MVLQNRCLRPLRSCDTLGAIEGHPGTYAHTMFDNLLAITIEDERQAGITHLDDATPAQVLDAQLATADVLTALGVPSDEAIDAKLQTLAAREAFTALNFSTDDNHQKLALTRLKVPEAVQHLVGMLTEYDWEFIDQAKQLRGYAVAKILEETKHPDARIRLKALQMLGNVTEVKLFTERVEVRKIDATEEEIESQLRERLAKFLAPSIVQEVPQAQAAPVEPDPAPDVFDHVQVRPEPGRPDTEAADGNAQGA